MAIFGLIVEGVTDHATIENILCGFYKNADLDEDIVYLQPPLDQTNKKQIKDGGGGRVLNYLSKTPKRFKDDVLNHDYLIIQIDSDIFRKKLSNIFSDYENKTLPIDGFINKIQDHLIQQISNKTGFYTEHQDKIIFAISVHSLECWILPLYHNCKDEKIEGCFKLLKHNSKKIKVKKNFDDYDKLTKDLSIFETLETVKLKSSSLRVFLSKLPSEI